MPKITINSHEIDVEKGTSILQAAEMIGVEIPRFCYHDRLSVPANCRMCLVQLEGAPKPVASCAMACADNMIVHTESDIVKKARKGVMEFLLINHPLDCPICDQGGECDLQDQAFAYGFDRSRYHENKRATKDKELGPLIKTIMTRCIHCTRCVRFGEEIAGVPILGFLNRGEEVEIGTFIETAVASELSGNMIDICPVGALTSKPYAFTARPWELTKTESIDVHDALGSNIRVDSRGVEVMRILPRLNEEINEEWIDDKTRFAYDGLKRQRLTKPYVRNMDTGKLEAASWEQAFVAIAERFKDLKADQKAALVGDLADLDSIVALKDLMQGAHLDCRVDGAEFDAKNPAHVRFNTTIEGLEKADAVLLVGTNPRMEAAILNARLRKTWLKNNQTKFAFIGDQCPDLTYPVAHLGQGVQALFDLKSGKNDFFKNAKNPVIIAGQGAFQQDGHAVQALLHDIAKQYNVIREDWNGYNMLHHAAARTGALAVGFTGEKSYTHIIDDARTGAIKALFLLGVDNDDLISLDKKGCFIIYQGHHGDAGAAVADVILPSCAYTEKNGLYVNTEGRLQLARQAVPPVGEAKEDWKIIRALSEVLGAALPYNNTAELRARISAEFGQVIAPDTILPQSWSDLPSKTPSKDIMFVPIVRNFYLTNPIARASKTMADCVAAFLRSDNDDLRKAG
jgi:NADH-quinone oxidoreductase subunit G